MAKKSNNSNGFLFKTGAFALLAGLAYWLFAQFSGNTSANATTTQQPSGERIEQSLVPDEILPAPNGHQVLKHTYFALAYNEAAEQADWVAYQLTREHLKMPWHNRPDAFFPDPMVETGSATHRDYSNSGYDRGHLCPAADMAFDSIAIAETFFMSNMSPQNREFNAGVWNNLEKQTRYWAKKYGMLYVVSGPVLAMGTDGSIGANKIAVPKAFYKVLLTEKRDFAIGFILPNEPSDKDIMDFACSIDEVEKATGLDFFPQLLGSKDGEWVEAALDKSAWPR